MNCPYCENYDSKVIDSRDTNDGIRRRRQCLQCGSRFTTYERWEFASLFVIKKDGRREDFNREKLAMGIRKALEKRPFSEDTADRLTDDIEGELSHLGKTEIPSSIIGDMVMARLKSLDHIAYIRFASVYQEFADITTLKEEVDTLASTAVFHYVDQLPLIPGEELEETVKGQRRGRK
jgi:transcriptional repressor NrdR